MKEREIWPREKENERLREGYRGEREKTKRECKLKSARKKRK